MSWLKWARILKSDISKNEQRDPNECDPNKRFFIIMNSSAVNEPVFLVPCYATLQPAMSVRRSVGRSVGPLLGSGLKRADDLCFHT